MSLLLVNIIGIAAGLCSMASFVPQLIKIAHEKKATGVSVRMFAITMIGFALWTLYGVAQGGWPLVIANSICLVLAGAIFLLRLRYGGD